jgi:hypothetical protein
MDEPTLSAAQLAHIAQEMERLGRLYRIKAADRQSIEDARHHSSQHLAAAYASHEVLTELEHRDSVSR